MTRTLEDIERDFKQAKKELEPIQKTWKEKLNAVNDLEDELLQYSLANGMYRPMPDLKHYSGKRIRHIKLVERNEDGTLDTKDMYDDEMFIVDKDGHLDYSSYIHGVMYFDDKTGKYLYQYHYRSTYYDFIGFFKIELNEED